MLFGAIHCFAWSFPFPSHTEVLLWRIASVATTGLPVFWVMFFAGGLFEDYDLVTAKDWIIYLFGFPAFIAVPLYIVGRIFIITLAFTTLRSLPPAAYQTVRWTTFIPHV